MGWVGRGEDGGLNEVPWVLYGWVGGWVGGVVDLWVHAVEGGFLAC